MQTWTIPNIITMFRLVLIVVFGVLLVAGHDGWAIAALAVAGISDFFDGYLARKWNQTTELGRILDPAADRILTAVVVVGLAVRGIIPWWLTAILLARDVVVGVALIIGKRKGTPTPHVTMMGKTATFGLFVALPLAFLAFDRWPVVHTVAIVLAVASTVLYWWSGLGYVQSAISGSTSGTSPTDAEPDSVLE